jgi:acyl-CoA synthetase (AMP-forming)/AMP-acid ligase II
MLDNHVDHGLAWLATGTMGSIEVGLNPQIRGQLLADCLQDSAAEILIVESKYAAEILGVLKDLPALRVLIVREGEEEEEGEANVALSGVEIARWRQLLDDLWPSEHARESPQRLYRPVDLNRRHGICN